MFLPSLETSILPHHLSVSDKERIDEEQRLLFVGVTRAGSVLSMSHCERRLYFGRVTHNARSPLIDDLKPPLVYQAINKFEIDKFIESNLSPQGETPTLHSLLSNKLDRSYSTKKVNLDSMISKIKPLTDE